MLEIKNLTDNAYGEAVRQYFLKTFPDRAKITKPELVEVITDLLVGTKDVRYGPIPSPESLVKVRNVIRMAIEDGQPIPALVAWGGAKTIQSAMLDVAEVTAIWQLIQTAKAVRSIYAPGMLINVRIEDTGAYWLYDKKDGSEALLMKKWIDIYSKGIRQLINNLQNDHSIIPILESKLMDTSEYFKRSKEWSVLLQDYIEFTDLYPNYYGKGEQYEELTKRGWKGEIPLEQRRYYRKAYESLYGAGSRDATRMLASYLAGAKVRYELNGRAAPAQEYIGISFVAPIPGAPESLFNGTLYYRTVPEKESRSHMPAWRAKGYLALDQTGRGKAKIVSWNNKEIIDQLTPHIIQIGSDSDAVSIKADYLVE